MQPAPRAREVVSGPVINMMTKSWSSLTAACPGTALGQGFAVASAGIAFPGGMPAHLGGGVPARLGGGMRRIDRVRNEGVDVLGLRLRGLRDEQRFQDQQGTSVFAYQSEGTAVPATADEYVPSIKGGVSGPYPWRQPV